ncbi:Bidirectional sugar transporter SWEET15 [Zostera marina]|uniref:Bidirectional sugar transporter SWEET n=1 Tax=Zostera marina TaxID=29655 RepID=A0A0K9PHD3_ZOSMR|nr:Bidirectional sugar transporter SWEET15 [Zostera marina]
MAIGVGNPWAFTAGVFGNVISFMVFFAPVPIFLRICRRKSTESFDSLPYVVPLLSAMIWLYFAFLTSDVLLMSINSAGIIVEGTYVLIFLYYADKHARALTLKLVMCLNVGVFGSLLVLTLILAKGNTRINIIGWAGSTFAVSVFMSPLSVIRLVIKTKSVEFMPFTLSVFLTLSATAWFAYGILRNDFYVAIPNVVGFIFGMVQMIVFVIYKDEKKVISSEENNNNIAKVGITSQSINMQDYVINSIV